MDDKVDGFGMPLFEMAIDRSQFETKVQEKFSGALHEKMFVLMATANGQTKWVNHKSFEVEKLLRQLLDIFSDYKRTGKWNPQTAAIEAIEFYRPKLERLIARAKREYEAYYKSKPKKSIELSDVTLFLDSTIESIKTVSSGK